MSEPGRPGSDAEPPDLYAGGALPPGALYIARAADDLLFDALAAGQHCHVLAPRQVGKTSLRIRTRRRLEAAPDGGRRCVSVDFTALGTEVAESDEAQDRWYLTLAAEMGRGLGLGLTAVSSHWRALDGLRGVDRFTRFVREVFLPAADGPVVVFFDEINTLLRLRFRGEWLGALRALHNERAADPRLARLTFCLIGFARAEDLVPDIVNNPFDITRMIALEDFTRAELEQATPALRGRLPTALEAPLLDAVHHWTSGHPLMTLALLREALATAPRPASPEALAPLVERLFPRDGLQAHPLLTAAGAWLQADWAQAPMARTQALYARLAAGERLPARAGDPVQGALRIGGLAAVREGALAVRNAVFARALDVDWASELLARRPLHDAATTWDRAGRSPAALPGHRTLTELADWAAGRSDLTELETVFLRAAHAARQRRVVMTVIGGAVVLLALVAAGGLSAIVVFRRDAEHQAAVAENLRAVTRDTRAADEAVIRLMTTELETEATLEVAQTQRASAERLLDLIKSTTPADVTPSPRLTDLETRVADLTQRTRVLGAALTQARADREAAERKLADATRQALAPVDGTPPNGPAVPASGGPAVASGSTNPSAPATPPPAAASAPLPVPAQGLADAAAIVQVAEAHNAALRHRRDDLDGEVVDLRRSLIETFKQDVLPARRPSAPRVSKPEDPLAAEVCVDALGIARETLEAEKRRLCAVATCLGDRNPNDACLAPAPTWNDVCR